MMSVALFLLHSPSISPRDPIPAGILQKVIIDYATISHRTVTVGINKVEPEIEIVL
jgi:hypothetical protein